MGSMSISRTFTRDSCKSEYTCLSFSISNTSLSAV